MVERFLGKRLLSQQVPICLQMVRSHLTIFCNTCVANVTLRIVKTSYSIYCTWVLSVIQFRGKLFHDKREYFTVSVIAIALKQKKRHKQTTITFISLPRTNPKSSLTLCYWLLLRYYVASISTAKPPWMFCSCTIYCTFYQL